MKKMELAVAFGFIVALVMAMFQIPFSRACETIRDETVRVHIVANSDLTVDQALKLEVRDAVLLAVEGAIASCATQEQALAALAANMPVIEQAAKDQLASRGVYYSVKAYICEMYFETRSYDDITLPAGEYTAVRVELGKAEGQNWWCVMYPPLCLPAAENQQELLEQNFSEDEISVLLGGERYAVRFKIEEWLSQLMWG